jgi:glutathione S-transferase
VWLQAPQYHLAPPEGTMARYRLIEKLSFISSEIHKGLGPLFAKPTPDVAAAIIKRIMAKVAILDKVLATQPFLLGDHFTVADAFLFVILGWHKLLNFDYTNMANIVAWRERVAALPAVAEAMRVEFS